MDGWVGPSTHPRVTAGRSRRGWLGNLSEMSESAKRPEATRDDSMIRAAREWHSTSGKSIMAAGEAIVPHTRCWERAPRSQVASRWTWEGKGRRRSAGSQGSRAPGWKSSTE